MICRALPCSAVPVLDVRSALFRVSISVRGSHLIGAPNKRYSRPHLDRPYLRVSISDSRSREPYLLQVLCSDRFSQVRLTS